MSILSTRRTSSRGQLACSASVMTIRQRCHECSASFSARRLLMSTVWRKISFRLSTSTMKRICCARRSGCDFHAQVFGRASGGGKSRFEAAARRLPVHRCVVVDCQIRSLRSQRRVVTKPGDLNPWPAIRGSEERRMVGATGFEPATFWSQTRRSTRLSYAPMTEGRGRRFIPAVNVILDRDGRRGAAFCCPSNLLDSPPLYPYTCRSTLLYPWIQFLVIATAATSRWPVFWLVCSP